MLTEMGVNVVEAEEEAPEGGEVAVREETAVAEAAVIGLPHPIWVEAVTAVIVPRAGATLTESAIIAHCRQHLAGFKVPKSVVVVEALPKNPSGKILKRHLRDQFVDLYTPVPGR